MSRTRNERDMHIADAYIPVYVEDIGLYLFSNSLYIYI